MPNAHDVGPQKCPHIGCIDAVDTDTVSIMKFPSTGKAELYAASVPSMFQVEDMVLVFASAIPPEAGLRAGGQRRYPLRIANQIAMMTVWASVIATSPGDPEVRAPATPLARRWRPGLLMNAAASEPSTIAFIA